MATGSQATKRAKRDAAGYVTGRPQHENRCGTCMLSAKPPGTERQTAHDLVCQLHATGVKTHGVCRGWLPKYLEVASVTPGRPVQLQFNQSGAWRSALNFDAAHVPDEFFQAAEDLVRLAGSNATMRIVMTKAGPSGSHVATSDVLMNWSRKKGWEKT